MNEWMNEWMNDVYFHLSKNFYKCEIERQKYMISKLIMHFYFILLLLLAHKPYTLGGIPRSEPPSCKAPLQLTIYTTLANFIEEC